MAFSDAPGPATHARQVLEPGERLLWAAFGRGFAYDVPGLDAVGLPQCSPLSSGRSAAGRGTAMLTLEIVSPSDRVAGEAPPTPEAIVFGTGPGCQAHEGVRELDPHGGSPARTWALTSTRLLVLDVDPTKPRAAEKPSTTLLRRTLGLGRGLLNIVTDRIKHYGENTEGVPVAPKPMRVFGAFPASAITEIKVARRRASMRTRPCLRISFPDDSGVDLLLAGDDESVFEWIVTLSGGGR